MKNTIVQGNRLELLSTILGGVFFGGQVFHFLTENGTQNVFFTVRKPIRIINFTQKYALLFSVSS